MISINQDASGVGGSLSRRSLLRAGTLGMAGLTLADWYRLRAEGLVAPAKAQRVIQIWLWGGSCHIDTFDPKPYAGPDYAGPFSRDLATNVPGVRLNPLLAKLAKMADKYSLIRSMTHNNFGHETASYMVQTGTMPSEDLVYPSLGAVVTYKKAGDAGTFKKIPPYIVMPTALGRFSESGFLGPNYKPFATGGNPNDPNFVVQGMGSRIVNTARTERRQRLLRQVDSLAKEMEEDPQFKAMDQFQDKAYGLILGDAKKAFDLNEETKELRDAYGRTEFGQSCLLARRLVERDVLFVSVNYGGWDTHKAHFETMNRKLPEFDTGLSALLNDLHERGLLESTLVVVTGEFGRTPKIATESPWNGGRHHFGTVFSALVAGGGFKGGSVVGATDFRGENVKERPVYPWDLTGTLYKLMGIDPAAPLPHPRGCVAQVTPTTSGRLPSGGLLSEII